MIYILHYKEDEFLTPAAIVGFSLVEEGTFGAAAEPAETVEQGSFPVAVVAGDGSDFANRNLHLRDVEG